MGCSQGSPLERKARAATADHGASSKHGLSSTGLINSKKKYLICKPHSFHSHFTACSYIAIYFEECILQFSSLFLNFLSLAPLLLSSISFSTTFAVEVCYIIYSFPPYPCSFQCTKYQVSPKKANNKPLPLNPV